jgi:molybdenum cofactor biosynthesis enzyme MoaA
MKHYCPIPFHHIAIRPNGTMQPCCAFRWNEIPSDFTINYKNLFYDHPFMNKIREDLKQDKPVAGCEGCYKAEELTGRSMRTEYMERITKKYGDNVPTEPNLTYIDLALSNVCNNRCRMCGPELSTNWYADTKALGGTIPSGLINLDSGFADNIDFSKLTYIKMIGGEPLMEQEKFISILEKCNLPKLSILIATNSTVRPNEKLLALFAKCNSVNWNLSIDSYGPLNNFLRKGSKWEQVAENLDWFAKTFPKKVKVVSVVSIYNANNFYELADYVKDKCDIGFNIVDGVEWMMPKNLPKDVKHRIKDKLKDLKHLFTPRVIDAINQQGNPSMFLENDKKLNTLRNETWFEHNSELYELLKEYYD